MRWIVSIILLLLPEIQPFLSSFAIPECLYHSTPGNRDFQRLGVLSLKGGLGSPPRDELDDAKAFYGLQHIDEDVFDEVGIGTDRKHTSDFEDAEDQRPLHRSLPQDDQFDWIDTDLSVVQKAEEIEQRHNLGPVEKLDPGLTEADQGPQDVFLPVVGSNSWDKGKRRLAPALTPFSINQPVTRSEGPVIAVPTEESCVPKGHIRSEQKEIIETWRETNEILLPLFAKREVEKHHNMTEKAKKGAFKPMRNERGMPLLTDFPEESQLIKHIEKVRKDVAPLTKDITVSEDPVVVQPVKMLREIRQATRIAKTLDEEQIACSLSKAETRDSLDWTKRNRLLQFTGNGSSYEDEEKGPEEAWHETQSRRANTVIAVLGTGRMGKRLAKLWAQGGFKVVMGSRENQRGKEIAAEIQASIDSEGSYNIPVEGGTLLFAVKQAAVLVLAVPFSEAAALIAEIGKEIYGKGKIIVDITNAKYDPNIIESTAGVEMHKELLGDPTASWTAAYKGVFAFKLKFGEDFAQTVDIAGDKPARVMVADMVRSHEWTPRVHGEVPAAAMLEPGRRVAELKQIFGDS